MSKRQLFYEPVEGEKIDSVIDRFGMYINNEGDHVFGVIGKTDCSADINSYLEQSDYSLIMSALNPAVSDFSYADDIIDMVCSIDPSDLIAVSRLSKNLELAFDELPLKEREFYENNPRKFTADVLRGEFADRIAKDREQLEIKQVTRPSADFSVGNSDELTALRKELDAVRAKIEQTANTTNGNQGGEQ